MAAVLLLTFRGGLGGGTPTLSYSELGAQLDRGNVERVELFPSTGALEGVLKRAIDVSGKETNRFRTELPFDDPAPLVARLEEHGVAIDVSRQSSTLLTLLMTLLPWVLIIGVWMLMLRQMRKGPTQALSFGTMGDKTIRPDRPKTTFDDVAGADEAKAELQEIIEFLKDPGRFQRLGGRMPKGVLLIGPPGTGKTLLARAVAGEAEVPFFSISGSDFVEMFVGVGAARVRDLFKTGKSNAPCIILIDELDAVGRVRGVGVGGGNDEREQTLNQLLVELDGFEPNDGVVLLAATNRPDVLDPALLRPGRFDRQIVVDLPDVRGREQILAVHARKVPLAGDVDLATVARGTPGLSGADLANLINEAALLAARRNKPAVSMADFEDAKDKVMLGVERRSLVLTDAERRLTAYHEAGHALLHLLVPGLDPLHKVSIVPRGRALGVTFSLPEEDRHNYTREYVRGRLVAAYGGRVAEEQIYGADKVTTGAAQDFQQATDLARRMVTEFGMSEALGPLSFAESGPAQVLARGDLIRRREHSEETARVIDAEVRRIASEAYNEAWRLIAEHRTELAAIALALIERETLTGPEVEALVRAGASRPVPPAPVT
ncbi:MAG: ATP-dependent zinc metalloprotease FtsH [Gemmatimonadales bacterium]